MQVFRKDHTGGAMTELLEKTWFIWWIVATLAILRWFHVVSINAGVELELEDANIEHEGIHSWSSAS